MTDLELIEAVVAQYEGFGWKLERILLRKPSNAVIAALPQVLTVTSQLDALWFSRIRGSGRAWELRRLRGTPFALVRVIDTDLSDRERDEILMAVEAEMATRDVKANGEISNGN